MNYYIKTCFENWLHKRLDGGKIHGLYIFVMAMHFYSEKLNSVFSPWLSTLGNIKTHRQDMINKVQRWNYCHYYFGKGKGS
jgi:hypothetical protein